MIKIIVREVKNRRLTEQLRRNRLIFLQRTCVARTGSEFYLRIFSLSVREQTTKSTIMRFPWLFKQAGIAGLRAPPCVMNNRDSLHGPFCSLFFSPSPTPCRSARRPTLIPHEYVEDRNRPGPGLFGSIYPWLFRMGR